MEILVYVMCYLMVCVPQNLSAVLKSAIIISMGHILQEKFIINSQRAWETLGKISHLIINPTGVLTNGKKVVKKMIIERHVHEELRTE